MMKRIVMAAVAVLLPLLASAQAQITTKKIKIEDFTEKTTKVVLTGNMFFDQAFKDEVKKRWRISPYEFCTLEEFQNLKTDDSYYFMMPVKARFNKETTPGLELLTVVKGGKDADKTLNDMLDVISVPVMAADNPSGREYTFLPAILDILQEHIIRSMERDITAYGGLSKSASRLRESGNMQVVFAEEDLSMEISDNVRKILGKNNMIFMEAEEADKLMDSHAPNTLVSYTVTPDQPQVGSWCYKMLINAETHELYYYKKHKISKKAGPGFLMEDINRIATR